MDKKTLVDDSNDLDFSYVCSVADFCTGVGDCAVHLHPVLMPLTHSAVPSPAFEGGAKGDAQGQP